MKLDRRLMTLRAAAAAAVVALAFTLTAIRPAPAFADTTVTVNTTLDETQAGNGTCSLREATLYANGVAEPDCATAPASGLTTITVPAGVYALTGGALSLTGNAAIAGADAATTTITAAGKSQVFVVAATAQRRDQRRDRRGGQHRDGVRRRNVRPRSAPVRDPRRRDRQCRLALAHPRDRQRKHHGRRRDQPPVHGRQSRGRVLRRQRRQRRRYQQHRHAHDHELDDHRELHRRWLPPARPVPPTSRPATPAAAGTGAGSVTPAR